MKSLLLLKKGFKICFSFLLFFFIIQTGSIYSQSCGFQPPASSPPSGSLFKTTCNSYPELRRSNPGPNENLFFTPNENTVPLEVKVNFIFVTDENGEKNFSPSNPAHIAFINDFVAKFKSRTTPLVSECVPPQLNQCATSSNYPDLNLEDDWTNGDAKIRFDVSTHWVPTSDWDNNPNAVTNGCDVTLLPGSSNWFLHNLDINLPNNCQVVPAVTPGINVYFTTDGLAYQNLVVNGNTSVNWCTNNASHYGSESNLNYHARNHMLNEYLSWYENRNDQSRLDNIVSWDIARSVFHEVIHNFGYLHNNCACNVMRTDYCGPRNMSFYLMKGLKNYIIFTLLLMVTF